jgi:hypothetical protein
MHWKLIGLLFFCASSLSAQGKARDPGPVFSVPRGFYTEAFELNLTTQDQAPLKYTLDGSDPRTSSRARRVEAPFALRIDPYDFNGRDRSAAVIVRASLANDPFAKVTTHTYLFAEQIRHLSPDAQAPGPGWPPIATGTTSQAIDYGLDPQVLEDPRYTDQIEAAFEAIPTVSISTATENIFDPQTGIYLNALERGRLWERPASIEWLYPDGDKDFQIDAGIRVRGGFSRRDFNPKHAFRLFFRSEYGKANLDYPLFGKEGADRFDKVDLRTSQNYAWSNGKQDGDLNLMNREVFSRDTQRDMGHPYTRSRYYHLFLNGVYWGLFQSQERAEAAFAATYLGGKRQDYDVVKVDPSNFPLKIEATDGDLDTWRRVYDLTQQGFATDTAYYRIQGKNPDGTANPAYEVLVDIDNLIDYMLIIFYGGNFDAPVTKFIGNKQPNNFFAIYDRRGGSGFRFFVHDAEHALLIARIYVGDGIRENRVNIADLDGNNRMTVDSFDNFHPQWLHHRLSAHPDYRARFAQRVQLHFFDDGALTPQANIDRFLARASQIENAIIAESARWGDAHVDKPHTQEDWRRGIANIVDHYFPLRGAIVLEQLQRAGLFPNLQRATFLTEGPPLTQGVLPIDADTPITVENPNDSGRIVYTTDGSDPRQASGLPSPTAQTALTALANIKVERTSIIRARILDETDSSLPQWSTLRQLVLAIEADLSDVLVSEIHYNPLKADSTDALDLEFVEISNAGDKILNLDFASFTNGIDYTFPAGSQLAPSRLLVLASDSRAFAQRYGFTPFGEYAGQLNNGGERLTLSTALGDTILTLVYDDSDGWPQEADGDGFSLVLDQEYARGPGPDFDDADQWHPSARIHGTPGWAEEITAVEETISLPANFGLRGNWPNPFNSNTLIAFEVPGDLAVRLVIHDVLGRRVHLLHDGEKLTAGSYRTTWNGLDDDNRPVASGVYLYRLVAGKEFSAVGRMALVR